MHDMEWLRLACGYVGVTIGLIGGNMVWLRHCHRAKKSNMDWFDGPWAHWKELTRRERRKLLAFGAIVLGSFAVFFVWLRPVTVTSMPQRE
jgi:hypothetical protein